MKDFKERFSSVKTKTQELIKLTEKGIDWLEKNGDNSTKQGKRQVVNENKITLNRVLQASEKRPSIAIFGQSQVGKSFLVRGLAQSPITSKLEVLNSFEDKKIDFLQEINPPGGRESTGIITRFSTSKPEGGNNNFPYKVELLSQLDIAAIITNGYLEDLKDYKEEIDKEEVLNEILRLNEEGKTSGNEISKDDAIDFSNFLLEMYKEDYRVRDLKNLGYFQDLIEVLPQINYEKRWEILHFLWGKNEFLTELFQKLSKTLSDVSFSAVVFVNEDAIINNTELGKSFSSTSNIIDVQRVKEIFSEKQLPDLKVLDKQNKECTVTRSAFSSLIKELHFELPKDFNESESKDFLNYTDILDFPGSKTREKVPETVFDTNVSEEKLSLFVRGKVSYLFYLYNRDIGISTLLYCMDNEPPLVTESPSLLKKWISQYIGETPETRKKHQENVKNLLNSEGVEIEAENISPLLIAMTKFNIELGGKGYADKDASSHDAKWFARFQENFSTYMSKPVTDKWTENWNSKGDTFKFIFPNRDPNFSRTVFEGYSLTGEETKIREESIGLVKDLEQSFMNSDIVDKFIFDKENIWNELTTPNETGIKYLCKYLAPSSHPANMLEQLNSITEKSIHSISEILKTEYQSGDMNEAMKIAKKKGAVAMAALMSLSNKKDNPLSDYLNQMVVSELEIWRLLYIYKFSGPSKKEDDKESIIDLTELRTFLNDNGISISEPLNGAQIKEELIELFGGIDEDEFHEILNDQFGVSFEDILKSETSSENENFADHILNFLADKLSSISSNKNKKMDRLLSNNNDAMNTIFAEIVKKEPQLKLKKQITEILDLHLKGDISKEQFNLLANCIASLLNKYIFSATWSFSNESNKPVGRISNKPIFSKQSELLLNPVLNKETLDRSWKSYIKEFSQGVKDLYTENVKLKFDLADEFDSASNEKIGEIINKIDQYKV